MCCYSEIIRPLWFFAIFFKACFISGSVALSFFILSFFITAVWGVMRFSQSLFSLFDWLSLLESYLCYSGCLCYALKKMTFTAIDGWSSYYFFWQEIMVYGLFKISEKNWSKSSCSICSDSQRSSVVSHLIRTILTTILGFRERIFLKGTDSPVRWVTNFSNSWYWARRFFN